jgi:hypothetical protein
MKGQLVTHKNGTRVLVTHEWYDSSGRRNLYGACVGGGWMFAYFEDFRIEGN